jgi:hypothetical protein
MDYGLKCNWELNHIFQRDHARERGFGYITPGAFGKEYRICLRIFLKKFLLSSV